MLPGRRRTRQRRRRTRRGRQGISRPTPGRAGLRDPWTPGLPSGLGRPRSIAHHAGGDWVNLRAPSPGPRGELRTESTCGGRSSPGGPRCALRVGARRA
ncbi:hypothetical protein NL676_005577 [Syzygium grande]|nr:hypothetical protein NL676_005577 [Syzygium grande]